MFVAGIDEAGRGPLAGPVVAAAIVLAPNRVPSGLTDSKKLSDKKREALFPELIESALAYSIVMIGPRDIERLNIRGATKQAMEQAAESVLHSLASPCYFLVDGNMALDPGLASEPIVKGDLKIQCISAASVLAKVARDREMRKLDEIYPQYSFSSHKGYPTAAHRELIQQHGPCEIHRRTFAGVREFL